jgi:acetyltransferase-like isoleucine patch superfamily enzyme
MAALATRLASWLTRRSEPRARPDFDPRRALADLHPTAVLHATASLQPQGRSPALIKVGACSHIRGELLLFAHGGAISLGEYCYVGEQTRIWSAREIRIGNRVLISHLCTIMDSLTHPLDPAQRHAQFKAIVTTGHPKEIELGEKPVVIEDDVLIGCQCVILRGVRIGAGAVVGAGSVVTSDVPRMTVAAGNPARVIRSLPEDARS